MKKFIVIIETLFFIRSLAVVKSQATALTIINKNKRDRIIFAAGLVIIALAGFFFLTESAEMKSESNQLEQNLVLGKLAYSRTVFTFSGAFTTVNTANSDGSGQIALTGFPPSASEPTWSPDAAKIAFVAFNANADIYVMNADGSGQTFLTNTMSANERNPSWSVTGKIAYERDGQIWAMNADGTNQAVFSGISQPSPTSPAWSPDGAKLLFTSGGEIWVINSDGTNEQRVTNNATTDADAAWSADGTKIVFTKGTGGIGIINANGTNEMNLTSGTNDIKPAWSNDGTKIAFARRGTAMNGIYTMDANGGNQVRIIADVPGSTGTENDNPTWQPVAQTPNTFSINGRITRGGASLNGVTVNLSGTTNAATTTNAVGNYQFSNLPTGGNYTISPSFANHFFTPANRSFNNLNTNQIADFVASEVCTTANCAKNGKIAFVRNSDIFTMNSDGTNQTNITNSGTTDTSPNYSPDGAKIIFTTDRDGNDEIYRMNADGSNPVRLTNNSASDVSPNFSSDGLSIVFVSNRDGNNEIYKMNSDGTNQVRLTTEAANDIVPTYSPDGSKIIFVTERLGSRRLFTMNADGSNQQVISNIAGFYNRPSYSPDGQKIIFVYGADVTAQTIWTMNADGTNRAQFPVGRSSPSYSPDGAKVVYVCCFANGQLMDGVRSVNADGGSAQNLTLGAQDDLPDWQPILAPRRTAFDFDGDGRADISVFRPSDRVWYLLRSNAGFSALQWGLSSDTIAPADYDGDLKTDVAVWRGAEGNFYILNSFNNTVRVENFGLSGDVPLAGDWDADGKADLSVYRGGAQSVFYYRASMGNPNGNITFVPWGISGDKPVVGDYDGDGKTDAAIFRPSSGIWYVRKSTDGQLSANNFGLANDTLVPADYDADGKTDLAVFRNGVWYILPSNSGIIRYAFWGLSTDKPVPADYDGDGRADVAVYRDGTWYVQQSTGGTSTVSFGLSNDIPTPIAYLP